MLGKLIKYEFKSTSRIMWFLYGALIIVGALLGLVLKVNSGDFNAMPIMGIIGEESKAFNILFGSLITIYVLMIQAIFIMTIVMIITRFNKNLLGGEGYLMHTLPVKTHNLILSKGIVAIIWGVIACVAGALSGFVLTLTSGLFSYVIRNATWEQIRTMMSEILTKNTFLAIVLVIVGAIASILSFYFAMAIGNLANKNKFLFAVLAYIGIQIVLSILLSIISVSAGGFFQVMLYEGKMSNFLIIQIIQQIILAVVYFFGTNYILKNKLNLA